jgi:hypothetical protein
VFVGLDGMFDLVEDWRLLTWVAVLDCAIVVHGRRLGVTRRGAVAKRLMLECVPAAGPSQAEHDRNK